MWKPRVLATLFLVSVVTASLLAVALVAARPLPSGPALDAGEAAPYVFSQSDTAVGPAETTEPSWQTWVNGVAWTQGMSITYETSDTIEIVNVVTTLPSRSIDLVEEWTPGELKLLDLQIQPGGSAHQVEVGRVTWEVPEGEPQVYTLTKWFHVEPCTWAETVLTETLSVPREPATERLVTVNKVPPALWIERDYVPTVHPGDVATFTLRYGNAGGYENSVWMRADLPSQAPFAWSDPVPDVVGDGRLMARWNVGDLAQDSTGEILVAVAITDTVPPPSTVEVWSGIFDHVNVVRDEVGTAFTVETPVQEVAWGKVVNGQPWGPDLVVTAQTSDTIEVLDVVRSDGSFILTETWNPEHLSLTEKVASAGELSTGTDRLEWGVPAGAGEVMLTKVFHVEPGYWGWTVLEEVLEVDDEPRVRLLPVRQRPVTFPEGEWPWYAQDEITVHPEPPLAGRPTELCAEVVNHDPEQGHPVLIEFAVADFGIGMHFNPVGRTEVWVPPGGRAAGCSVWVPPTEDAWCIEVRLMEEEGAPYMISQRNIDLDEPLIPNTLHERTFPVRNPFDDVVTVTLGLIPHLPGWGLELSQDVLTSIDPGTVREVTLGVTPPGEMPGDGTPVVDVEAFVGDEMFGGFRKIFRPPVPLHRFPDPVYAEREITVHPYPPRAGEPTEVCAELYNPTPVTQTAALQFSWAHFGIGIPFTPIDGLRSVHLPPSGTVNTCITWIPPLTGHVCLQVELHMDGYEPQRSQRNIDIDEPLVPGVPHTLPFPVGNPFEEPMTITLELIPQIDGWEFALSERVLPGVVRDEPHVVNLTVQPPPGVPLPPDATTIVDVEAYAERPGVERRLIGGFRKIHRPPVPLHPFPDPRYAEREITVDPYPPRAGEPTEVCVELRNPTGFPQDVAVQFSWANFGIGIAFTPIDGLRPVHLPPYSIVRECIHWVPPVGGNLCLQVELFMEGYEPQRSRLNIDADEPLEPLTPHARLFPVRNPFDHAVTITLGLIPHFPDWGLELSQDVLPNMDKGETREIVLTVTPPADLPADGDPIVDVEAYVEGELIGGFRKIFRPPVPIHRPRDPVYAESEIFIQPYPPRAFEPTEVGVEIRNPTEEPQTVTVTFGAADFGIGLPFDPIHAPLVVTVPPLGVVHPAIMWVPPHGGLWCIEVALALPGHEAVFISRRNIDVGEPLEPLTPHSRPFPVHNPFDRPVTITLGLIPHFPDWGLELSQDVLPDMAKGETREVVLTVTPPADLPADGDAIVDVEAFVDGELLGGFRKIFRPPVPVHRPRDPVYAESEIGVDPYPALPGQPTALSVEVFNPTDMDRVVTVTFSIADFGIGLPFSTANIVPNPIRIFVPKFGAARGHVIWTPPDWGGKFCVRVTLELEDYDPIWSQRNIDVGEPLEPGVPHAMAFLVGGWPNTGPVTVSLGLIPHKDGWGLALSQDVLANLQPGEPVPVTLTVTPPTDAELGSGDPIVDVEGFVDGELIGGFRKLDRPPIPLHKPHERGYAESEIIIEPYPPDQGVATAVSTVVQNTSDVTMTVDLEFGWADFGIGIPFTTTGMVPYTRSVTLGPEMTKTATVAWTPVQSGHQCVQIRLHTEGYESQESQRNVDVAERPPCDETKVFTFTVYNDSPLATTVDVGMITFNVPADWQITVTPSPTLELGAWDEGTVTVTVQIPCPPTLQVLQSLRSIQAVQEAAGSIPTIDVEGYVEGQLKGGIEIQFAAPATEQHWIYMPLVLRNQ